MGQRVRPPLSPLAGNNGDCLLDGQHFRNFTYPETQEIIAQWAGTKNRGPDVDMYP